MKTSTVHRLNTPAMGVFIFATIVLGAYHLASCIVIAEIGGRWPDILLYGSIGLTFFWLIAAFTWLVNDAMKQRSGQHTCGHNSKGQR